MTAGFFTEIAYLSRRYPLGVAGAIIMFVFVFAALFAGTVAPLDPFTTNPRASLSPPNGTYLMGADMMGRDVFSRMIHGARISLAVAIGATFLGSGLGAALGLSSGYLGGWFDLLVQRVAEIMQSLPLLVMALVITAALGPSLVNTIIAIAIPLVPNVARVIRSNVLSLRELPFVEAAKATGMSEWRIAIVHVLPNTLAPLIVLATAQLGSTILTEASLSFLGLGVPEPWPSWGRMLSESAAEYVRTAPWLVIFPGLAISLVVFGTNLLGDALRDALDPQAARLMAPVLEVSGLNTVFHTRTGLVHAVRDVSFSVEAGETLAIVGESGCGKTMTALSLMRLIPSPPGEIVSGSVVVGGTDLLRVDEATMRHMRGREIAMIFQEPMTALNPLLTIGRQIAEMVVLHDRISRSAARVRAIEMLRHVRIPEPERRAREYPHQMSGGMRQRAMIAMALACRPKILIADEPTTALDVTIQAQILDLIGDLRREFGTAVVLITHDLGVVAETANRVIVMYAGRKVEEAPVRELFARPLHPYMTGLLSSIPKVGSARGLVGLEERLTEIPGIVPPLNALPPGCAFSPRCGRAVEECRVTVPDFEMKRPDHFAACWRS